MYSSHKVLCLFNFALVFLASFCFDFILTESTTQNLVTFFSILFGFYITAASVLYGSVYAKGMYKKIDDKIPSQTQLHTIRLYFRSSAILTLFSIFVIILFSLIAMPNDVGILHLDPPAYEIHIFRYDVTIPIELICVSAVLSMAATNLVLSNLLLKVFLIGLVEEARSEA